MGAALPQGPLLWRHNDVVVSRNTRRSEWDTGYAYSRPSRASNPLIICRISMQFVAYSCEITPCVWFDTIIGWIESLGVFHKCSDVRTGKQFIVKSLELSFQSVNIVIFSLIWSLGDFSEILVSFFSSWILWLMAEVCLVKLPSDECQWPYWR